MQEFKPQFNRVNITALIQKELSHADQLILEKNLKVNLHDRPDYFINTDENFATVILRNLLQNAIKYSENGSELDIREEPESLGIRNKSINASAVKLNNILQNKEVNSNSSGLGLQIANDLTTVIRSKVQFVQDGPDYIITLLTWQV